MHRFSSRYHRERKKKNTKKKQNQEEEKKILKQKIIHAEVGDYSAVQQSENVKVILNRDILCIGMHAWAQ